MPNDLKTRPEDGALVVGFVGGYRSGRAGPIRPETDTRNSTKPTPPAAIQAHIPENCGGRGNNSKGATLDGSSGMLASLGERFEPELAELRGLVVGTLLGIAREVIISQARRTAEESGGKESDDRRSKPME